MKINEVIWIMRDEDGGIKVGLISGRCGVSRDETVQIAVDLARDLVSMYESEAAEARAAAAAAAVAAAGLQQDKAGK